MQKKHFLVVASVAIMTTLTVADGLKDSLTNILHTKDKLPSIINLGTIDLNAKPRPIVVPHRTSDNADYPQQEIVVPKRSRNAVVANVDGRKILKKEADSFLSKATKGKIKDMDLLSPKQQKKLIAAVSQMKKKRPKNAVVGKVAGRKILKKEADAYLSKVTKGKIKDMDLLSPEQQKKLIASFPKPVKKRSKNAVIALVNGHKILKKEADARLKKLTKGKMKNIDLLPKDQQKKLIEDLALPLLVKKMAKKELSNEEKKSIYVRLWMQKKSKKTKVSDAEAKVLYTQMQADANKANASKSDVNQTSASKAFKTNKLPPFSALKERLKMQIKEKVIVGKLMENVQIKVF